jgi:hypothetical protein
LVEAANPRDQTAIRPWHGIVAANHFLKNDLCDHRMPQRDGVSINPSNAEKPLSDLQAALNRR